MTGKGERKEKYIFRYPCYWAWWYIREGYIGKKGFGAL